VVVQERIQTKLKDSLDPLHLEVINESHMHSVPKGEEGLAAGEPDPSKTKRETHFKVVVVSPRFDGLSPVKRHQLVYGALAEELKSGVHALAITSRTPSEWEASPEANASPKCLGGNGK
jgi:stress-induced morphogen